MDPSITGNIIVQVEGHFHPILKNSIGSKQFIDIPNEASKFLTKGRGLFLGGGDLVHFPYKTSVQKQPFEKNYI